MSFDTEVLKEGRGAVFRLDLSGDGFSTIAWRFGDKGLEDLGDGVPMDARVVSFGTLSRAFAEDRSLSPATLDVTLANEDGALDALVDDWAATLRLRARFYVGLFEAGVGWPITWKQLGEYVVADNPRRRGATISFGLEDISRELGDIRTPTIAEWYAADMECPFYWLTPEDRATAMLDSNWTKQLPVAWGDLPVPLTLFKGLVGGPASYDNGHGLVSNRYQGLTAWVVCATLNDMPPTDGTVGDVAYQWKEGVQANTNTTAPSDGSGNETAVNQANYMPRYTAHGSYRWQVWRERKSGPVTIDGRDWYILWLEVDVLGWMAAQKAAKDSGLRVDAKGHVYVPGVNLGNYDITDYLDQTNRPNGEPTARYERESNWARACLQSDALQAWALRVSRVGVTQANVRQHPVDIIEDLAAMAGALTDGARLTLARGTCPSTEGSFLLNAGAEQAGSSGVNEALSALGPSMDLDIFMTWAGKITCVGSNETLEASVGALPAFPEQELGEVSDWIPSRQQRGAYANRLELESQAEEALTGPLMEEVGVGWYAPRAGLPRVLVGPFDFPDAPVTTQERIITRTLSARWTPPSYLGLNPWSYRAVTATARKRISFVTGLRALTLELGDYFTLDWRRGLAAPALYEGTVFQAIGFALDPAACTVEVSALWSGDLRINRPYLLDEEALNYRIADAGGTTLVVEDGVDQVVRSGAFLSFVTAGVQVGDILVLKDASEWLRCRALRITHVTASQLTVADEAPYGLDFEAPGGATVSSWVIMRGASTAHTAVTDPTNYPLGSDGYGKVANQVATGGTYSNGGFAHVLGG